MIEYKTVEMDRLLKDPNLLAAARNMTLHSYSGMNSALNYYQAIIQGRSVRAYAIFAYDDGGEEYISLTGITRKFVERGGPIGWALVSKESDNLCFTAKEGHACAQVYVEPSYRLKGIGRQLIKLAEQVSKDDIISVYAHNNVGFFQSFMTQSNFRAI